MKVIKESLGIDVSKDFLDCCLGSVNEDQQQHYSKVKSFPNNEKGFSELVSWIRKKKSCHEVCFVMEATGIYYENLAYWLHERSLFVSVLLPNKVKHFAKSHNIKTKTDWVDAQIISKIGLERNLSRWSVPSQLMREIKHLTREYRELKVKASCAKNQLHAKENSYKCPSTVVRRLKKQINLMETQIVEVEAELRVLVMSDTVLQDKIECIETIPGVSFITIICVLGETNAFALVRNAKQLVSYCGLDIRHNQSGSRKGKTRISKKGNSYVRSALYMPALCAIKHNPTLKKFYGNLIERKPAKKIAVTAVARKLLILIYILWKNQQEFSPAV